MDHTADIPTSKPRVSDSLGHWQFEAALASRVYKGLSGDT